MSESPSEELATTPAASAQVGLRGLSEVPLQVEVCLGSAQLTLSELLQLTSGSIITLNRRTGDPVEVLINGKVVARGEIVVVDGELGVRLLEICGEEGGGTGGV